LESHRHRFLFKSYFYFWIDTRHFDSPMSGNVGSAISKSGMTENVSAVEIASSSLSVQKVFIFLVY
jgi:hypothetical protein